MATLEPLPSTERERLLALIGIERWVLRDAPAADSGSDPGRDAGAEPSRPGPLPQLPAARLAIVAGDAKPLAGRHAALLRHVLRALAVNEESVAWEARDGIPVLAFGAAPGDAPHAVLAPPLATLRASGAARRSMWPALRGLRKRLRGAR
jgi:DNA polymerase III psi subunit